MTLIEKEELAHLLRGTLSPRKDVREAAENHITQLRTRRLYIASLLQVSIDNSLPIEVQQSSAIELKNSIRRTWTKPKKANNATESAYNIDEEEKAMIRDSFISALSQVAGNRKIIKILSDCLSTLARADFPKNWPNLVNQIHQNIQSGDLSLCIASLVTVDKIIKATRMQVNQNLVQDIFPMLTRLSSQVIKGYQDTEEVWTVICLLSKIYHGCVNYKLPKLLQGIEFANTWILFLNKVLTLPVSSEQIMKFPGIKRKMPQWVAKKYAIKSLYRLFERYSYKQYCDENELPFAAYFHKKSTISGSNNSLFEHSLNTSFSVVQEYMNDNFITEVVLKYSLFFICKSCELSTGFAIVKPHLPLILQNVIIPLVAIKPSDLETWVTDEVQFIRDKFSLDFILNVSDDSSEAACSFIAELSYYRLQYILPILLEQVEKLLSSDSITESIVSNVTKKYNVGLEVLVSEQTYQDITPQEFTFAIRKLTAFVILENLSRTLLTENKYISQQQVSEMVSNKILPELKNKFGFVRYFALRSLTKYFRIKWTNDSLQVNLAESVLSLFNDTELPVVAQTCYTVMRLEQSKNVIFLQVISKNLSFVIQKLLETSRKIVLEDIYETLQNLIATFSHQMGPMANELLEELSKSFITMFSAENESNNDQNQSHGDFNETEIVAIDCLSSINELLVAIGEQENGSQQLSNCSKSVITSLLVVFIGVENTKLVLNNTKDTESHLVPDINLKLEGDSVDNVDYLQTALETTRILTFYSKNIPFQLWRIIPYIYMEYKSWAIDYTQDFCATFENMVQYNIEGLFKYTFCENIKLGYTNFDILLQFTNFGLQQKHPDLTETDKVPILSLLEVLLQSIKIALLKGLDLKLPENIANIVSELVNFVLQALQVSESDVYKKSLLLLLYACFFYDANLTSQTIGKEKIETVSLYWLDYVDHHISLSEQLGCLFGLISLLSVANELSSSLTQRIVQEIAKLRVSVLERKAAEQKRREVDKEEKRLTQEAIQNGNSEILASVMKDIDEDPLDFKTLKHSKYPFDVPEHLTVLSPDYTNKFPETFQELRQLQQYFPGGLDLKDVDENSHLEQVSEVKEEIDFDAMSPDEIYDLIGKNEFGLEEEEEGEEESPLENLNEGRYFVQILNSAPSTTQQNVQSCINSMNSDGKKAIESLLGNNGS